MSALVWCPFPDRAIAREVATALLDKQLIACANILGDMESLYEWNGERGESSEVGVLFKTTAALLNETVGCLAKLHPYDTPAILGWNCDVASADTQSWLSELNRGK